MPKSLRRRCWLKVAVLLAAGGSLLQTSTCNQDVSALGQDLAISIVDQLITSYFSDQFNASGSIF